MFVDLDMMIPEPLAKPDPCAASVLTFHAMLTGGRSASKLYKSGPIFFSKLKPPRYLNFYFGDERCVPPEHPDSNYGMVMRTLFHTGSPANCIIHRMQADTVDLHAAADQYASLLPESIDVLLLSVGEDGHIASLFPHSPALQERSRLVVPVIGPKPPFQRLTITPHVIQRARRVFVLALGEEKRAIYEKALCNPSNIDEIPARLVLHAEWIFDINRFDLACIVR